MEQVRSETAGHGTAVPVATGRPGGDGHSGGAAAAEVRLAMARGRGAAAAPGRHPPARVVSVGARRRSLQDPQSHGAGGWWGWWRGGGVDDAQPC